MDTFNFYKDALTNYVHFEGRASRKQYWYFVLWNAIIFTGISIILNIILQGNGMYVSWIYNLAILLPSLAIAIRRLHDIGKSGWWLCILLIPIVGAIVILIFLITPGEPGTNAHGTNPNEVSGVSAMPAPTATPVAPAPAPEPAPMPEAAPVMPADPVELPAPTEPAA